MAAPCESEGSTSLPVLSASPDVFMDAENFAASLDVLTDPLGSHDFDPFIFESRDMSPEWLNDTFSTPERETVNSVTRSTGTIRAEYLWNVQTTPQWRAVEIHKVFASA